MNASNKLEGLDTLIHPLQSQNESQIKEESENKEQSTQNKDKSLNQLSETKSIVIQSQNEGVQSIKYTT